MSAAKSLFYLSANCVVPHTKRSAMVLTQDSEAIEPPEPEHLVCPITLFMFRDPVMTTTGQTYERSAIEKHLQTKTTDPLTGVPI